MSLCERQRLVTPELVAPRLVGTGLLAAGEAARLAAVGQLPGDEQGRTVIVGRAPLHRIRDQVKRMYGWAITCSETSSSVGVSQRGFSRARLDSRLRVDGLLCACGWIVESLILPPSVVGNDINCQRVAPG